MTQGADEIIEQPEQAYGKLENQIEQQSDLNQVSQSSQVDIELATLTKVIGEENNNNNESGINNNNSNTNNNDDNTSNNNNNNNNSYNQEGEKKNLQYSDAVMIAQGVPEPTTYGPQEGIEGWIVTFGVFLMHIVVLGIHYSNGIFVLPYSKEFNLGRGTVSLFVSLVVIFWFGSGSFMGRLGDRIGVRITSSVSGILLTLCILISSFANEMWLIFLFQGVGVGLSFSLLYFPGISVISQWFVKKRGTATGFAAAGSGVGSFVFAPIIQYLITNQGWRYALRVVCIMTAVMLTISTWLTRRRIPTVKKKGGVNWALLKNKNFSLIGGAVMLMNFGYMVPFVHLVPFAVDAGVSLENASLLLSIIGATSAGGRLIIGFLSDRVGALRTIIICFFILSIDMAVWPACTNFPSLVVFSVVFGFSAGSFVATVPVLVATEFGVEQMSGNMGLIFTGNALSAVSAPIVGYIYDTTGSYTIGIEGAAVLCFASCVCLLFVRPKQGHVQHIRDVKSSQKRSGFFHF